MQRAHGRPCENDSPVTRDDLEHELQWLCDVAAGPGEGVFGPGSRVWHVNRESAIFLAAGRAALLQLAHPWVAAALAEHSTTLRDPVGRFHGTFRMVFTMVFGTLDQALDASRRLHRRHDRIQGALPASEARTAGPVHYRANDPGALQWVHATLVDSALAGYELLLPPLGPADRERYHDESHRFAALFGIPRATLPASWDGFQVYFADTLHSSTLAVTPRARQIAADLLSGVGTRLRSPRWYRTLTASLLPAHLRSAFGLDFSSPEREHLDRVLRRLRRLYPLLPAAVRHVGPCREAQARLAGHLHLGLATRLSNRFWTGRPRLG